MSQRARLEKLEDQVGPPGAIRILVLRIPAGVPEDEEAAYVRGHPEALDRVIEYPRPGDVVQAWGEQRRGGFDDN